MKIDGLEISIDPKTYPRFLLREYSEGKRLKIKEFWVDSYYFDPIKGIIEYSAHKVTVNNYGTITLDDKQIRDKDDIKKINELLTEIESNLSE